MKENVDAENLPTDAAQHASSSSRYENRITHLEGLSKSIDTPEQFKWMGKRMKNKGR